MAMLLSLSFAVGYIGAEDEIDDEGNIRTSDVNEKDQMAIRHCCWHVGRGTWR